MCEPSVPLIRLTGVARIRLHQLGDYARDHPPIITRRVRGRLSGKCCLIAVHAAYDNQNNAPATPKPPLTGDPLNQQAAAESSC